MLMSPSVMAPRLVLQLAPLLLPLRPPPLPPLWLPQSVPLSLLLPLPPQLPLLLPWKMPWMLIPPSVFLPSPRLALQLALQLPVSELPA